MHPKDAYGMANSVDPDQTASSEAVRSWSALFAETYLCQYIEFVRYILFLPVNFNYVCCCQSRLLSWVTSVIMDTLPL